MKRPAVVELLNVSYDPTRELHQEVNAALTRLWLQTAGQAVAVTMSHGGSGDQALTVIDGLEADVVKVALAHDIDEISAKAELLPRDWQARLPRSSSPYTSAIAFLVRAGNPKSIKDWDDLNKPGVAVITPNSRTSGGARWNYLATWGYVLTQGGDDARASELVGQMFRNVPVLDSGARGSTSTFAQRGIGDALLAWESEAFLAQQEIGRDRVNIIVPSLSMLAEPPVAIVDRVVDKKGTRRVAEAYLQNLYSAEGQELAAKHHYRPGDPSIAARHTATFPQISLLSIDDTFGGWSWAQAEQFSDGGVFDLIYQPGR